MKKTLIVVLLLTCTFATTPSKVFAGGHRGHGGHNGYDVWEVAGASIVTYAGIRAIDGIANAMSPQRVVVQQQPAYAAPGYQPVYPQSAQYPSACEGRSASWCYGYMAGQQRRAAAQAQAEAMDGYRFGGGE